MSNIYYKLSVKHFYNPHLPAGCGAGGRLLEVAGRVDRRDPHAEIPATGGSSPGFGYIERCPIR